ncbi:MAG TPA: M23 family metallopeptidase [Croceibacterium sp.]|nr:M23 family metallopeptidase [Croceibacterium sp.]
MVLKHVFGALAALVVSTNPAMANETAAATQITGAIDAANASTASGDREFQELFASWKSMDQTGVITSSPVGRVSVPTGMPVQDSTLTSNFGMRTHPVLGGRRGHNGVDLAQPTGTPVYATADGLVSKAERFSSYGNYIQIEHGGELQTRYAHLSGYAVTAGEQVRKGQLIGYVGSTGRSTGPHLHYEIRVAGEAVDPTPYMAETQLAVSNDAALGRGGPE